MFALAFTSYESLGLAEVYDASIYLLCLMSN